MNNLTKMMNNLQEEIFVVCAEFVEIQNSKTFTELFKQNAKQKFILKFAKKNNLFQT